MLRLFALHFGLPQKSPCVVSCFRPDPSGWTVPSHAAALTVRYKVFGDRVDGTYLAIGTEHVHMNMPAAFMWARGLDDSGRPILLRTASNAGHGIGTSLDERIEQDADVLSFLFDQLGVSYTPPAP